MGTDACALAFALALGAALIVGANVLPELGAHEAMARLAAATTMAPNVRLTVIPT